MTSEFDNAFPSDRFIRVPSVALLDEHSMPKGRAGEKSTVTAEDLKKIAENNNARWEATKDATAVCIGHTIDDAPETDQPPLVGWAVNFRTEPFFDTGRTALYADFYIRKDKANVIEDFPRRSVEYWVGRKQVEPISLLSSTTPERDLGVLKFHRDANDSVYRYSLKSPKPISTSTGNPMPDDKNPTAMTDPKAMNATPDADTQKIVEMVLASKPMVELMSTFTQFKQLLAELENEQGDEGEGADKGKGGDLLEPVDGDDDAGEDKAKGKPKDDTDPKADKGEKDQRKSNEPPPVKFESSGTNCYVPTTESEKKTKMSRETAAPSDEVLKYKREFETYKATTEKVLKETAKKFQRMKAEKTAAELQTTEGIDFGDKDNLERELDLMSNLSDAAFDTHVERIKLNYKRRTPDSAGVSEAVKYSRSTLGEGKGINSVEDALRAAETALRAGVGYEEAIAKGLIK